MANVPLKADILAHDLRFLSEEGARPRDWEPRRGTLKGPLRLVRLCVLGTFLPAFLITGPMYLRYRVYSDQLYPLAASDQRLIDGKVSTTWCQRQLVKVNGTFNAYLMSEKPEIKTETVPVSMTRHLVLEDDMKEYWGFYLLRGSSVTVSTCVRWPGASLTIIRGHKHLHECAFIGDDSSEELEELIEIAEERGLLNMTSFAEIAQPINEPDRMKRVRDGIKFLDEGSTPGENHTLPNSFVHQFSSHELDSKSMRNILTQLFAKTLETKKKQTENPHHHYEGTFKEISNIDRPPIILPDSDQDLIEETQTKRPDKLKKISSSSSYLPKISIVKRESDEEIQTTTKTTTTTTTIKSTIIQDTINKTYEGNSEEVFEEVLAKLQTLGIRGKSVLRKLIDEIGDYENPERNYLRKIVDDAVNDDRGNGMSSEEQARRRRDIILSSPLNAELNDDDSDGNAAIEEDFLTPDGIAEDRGTVNETTLNDRSNSEFWSSFSSSEERLLECNGLILNLPLTPNRRCTPKYENEHDAASLANTITYRVPTDGYYFFVFNSENEMQPNYIRIQFNLLKTLYDTSNSAQSCSNSTSECSLPLKFFSDQKTVLELPVTGNDSQWNEEYVVVSTCEPRTAIYVLCIISVPLLVLIFAFH